jgi:TonB family protein
MDPARTRRPSLALLLALALGVGAAAAAPEPPRRVSNPDWLVKPSGAALGEVYPHFANLMGVGGFVRLSCHLSATGLPKVCQVRAERPRGLGFGAAAVKLSAGFRFRPATTTAGPIESDVDIPIKFAPQADGTKRLLRILSGAAVLLALYMSGLFTPRRAAAA